MLLNGVDRFSCGFVKHRPEELMPLRPLRRLRPLINLPIVAWGQIIRGGSPAVY